MNKSKLNASNDLKQQKNKVVILGIDTFAYKNVYQAKCLYNNDFELHIFTNDKLKTSFEILNNFFNAQEREKIFIHIMSSSFFYRLNQINRFFMKNYKLIHHVEIYPYGRFSPVYLFICKIFNTTTITVERGDILKYEQYSLLFQNILRFMYNGGNLIWYKELYMKEKLQKITSTKLYFLYNCVNVNLDKIIPVKEKTYTFLWVNRLIPQRKVEWFIDAVNKLKKGKNVIVGVLGNSKIEQYVLQLKNKYLKGLKYQPPKDFYLNSKFFVLPSDIVFLNHALLEAMSYGVVPLASNVEGTKLIIEDGVDGFIFEHTKEGLIQAMEKALSLTEEEYISMSNNARKKAEENFSCQKWCQKYMEMITNV